MLTGLAAGIIYPVFADGFDDTLAFINGILIGLTGSILVGLFEVYLFDRRWKYTNFLLTALTKTGLYTLLLVITIIMVKAFNESIYYGQSFWSYLKGKRLSHFIYDEDFDLIILYSMAIIGLIIFGNLISRKMGTGVLWNLVSGKYHTPRKERITMMLFDLKSSTKITESLGPERYHHFISDFYKHIAPSILSAKGRVYRYVGDQIAIFWNHDNGTEYKKAIGLYLEVKEIIVKLKQYYLDKYGYYPAFRVCGHTGELVVGELGDVKSQIVFHGPALYTCDLIENKCKELGVDFLVSSDFVDQAFVPDKQEILKIGTVSTTQQSELGIYTIK